MYAAAEMILFICKGVPGIMTVTYVGTEKYKVSEALKCRSLSSWLITLSCSYPDEKADQICVYLLYLL